MFESNVITGNTANDIFVLDGYTGGGKGTTRDATLLNTNFQQPRFMNCEVGTAIVVDGHGGGTTRGGIVEVTKQVTFTIRDAEGNPIPDAVIFIQDTDNGQRRNPLTATRTFTDTKEHILVTGANGMPSNPVEVLTGAVISNANAQGQPAGGTDGVAGTGSYRWDRRSKNNDNTDTFDAIVWTYHELLSIITDGFLGTGLKNIPGVQFPDLAVTEQNRATVAAYTGIVLNHSTTTITVSEDHTLEELYDFLKYSKTLPANVKLPTPNTNTVLAQGTRLNFGAYDIVITGDVTTTSKFQSIVTTGAVTISGSGEFDGAITDENGIRLTLKSNRPNTLFFCEIVAADDSRTTSFVTSGTDGVKRITVPATATLRITAKARAYKYLKVTVDPNLTQNVSISLLPEADVDIGVAITGNEGATEAALTNHYFNYVESKSQLVFGITTSLKGDVEKSKAQFDDRITSEAGLTWLHYFDDTITDLDGLAYQILNDRIFINESHLEFVRQAGLTAAQKSFFGCAVYLKDGITPYTPPISNNDDVRISDLAEIFVLNSLTVADAAIQLAANPDYVDGLKNPIVTDTLAGINPDLATILAQATLARKYQGNRKRVDPTANTKTYYDDDKTTVLLEKDLKDVSGDASTDDAVEETPV